MERTARLGALAVLLVVIAAHAQEAEGPPEAESPPQPDVAALQKRIAGLEEENRILREFLSRRGLKPDAIIAAARGRAQTEPTEAADGTNGGDDTRTTIHFRSIYEVIRGYPEEVLPPGKNVEWGRLVTDATAGWAQEHLVGKRVRVAAFFAKAQPLKAGQRVSGYAVADDSVYALFYPGRVLKYRAEERPYRVETKYKLRGHTVTIAVEAIFPDSATMKLAAMDRQLQERTKPQVETVLHGRIALAHVDGGRAYVLLDQCELQGK